MNHQRQILLHWAKNGHISAENLEKSLKITNTYPETSSWFTFFKNLFLSLGILLFTSGVIFFFAFNWKEMGQFLKFGLVEGLIIVSLLAVWKLDLDQPAGKGALIGASVFIGVLLALIGQTYQTGADSYLLFGYWALMITPWVLLGRSNILAVLWLALLNLTMVLYIKLFNRFVFGFIFSDSQDILWALFFFNALAWMVWELLAIKGSDWLKPRWPIRLISTVAGINITWLALFNILAFDHIVSLIVWAVWLGLIYWVYRKQLLDVYILSGGVLSVVVIATTLMIRLTFEGFGDFFLSFLMVSVTVIGVSAVGGNWLKKIVQEELHES